MENLNSREFKKLEPGLGFYNIGVHPHMDNVLTVTLTPSQGRVGIPAERWAGHIYTDKLSCILTSADKYGVYFSYYSIRRINEGEDGSYSLYATLEDLGIHPCAVTKAVLDDYLVLLQKYIYTKFFKHVLSLGSRARRVALRWLHDVQSGDEMWRIDNRYKLIREGNLYNIYLCDTHRMVTRLEPERLTVNMFQ
ncbi:hypothetical protein pETSU_177 [Edwardsiella phage pEt-SU]|uniref:Uncharacterized protein n=1 Tax=Edwardsiella phage pEt-SU TaxID=2562142 RepID=A0A4D6DX13_9CAUD|nr:hypothetical protein HOV39_gp177 [Edwardsiella phage pEt-SU]QBZ70758.1 hypothetical protein pETSU_177 [Edwardsiella phage pEt-SU]